VRQQVREGTWTFGEVIDGWYAHLERRCKMGDKMERGSVGLYRATVEKHIRPHLAKLDARIARPDGTPETGAEGRRPSGQDEPEVPAPADANGQPRATTHIA
jgi:hypothetical protein